MKKFIKRNSSTILTCLGGVGVIATATLAVKATPKALLILEEAEREKGEKLTKMEVVRVAGPAYIPTVLTGTATIAAIFGANILNKRQQASIMSAYALLDNSYKEYKKKVKEMLGEDGELEIRDEIAKDKYAGDEKPVYDDEVLFYDEFSGQYFTSTKYNVQRAQYSVNRDINLHGAVSLEEYYSELGINVPKGSELLGWSEGMNMDYYWQGWVDFQHRVVMIEDDLECIIISMIQEPYINFEDN